MAGLKTTLQIRTAQTLAMTPQLQQAIRLLQLSSLELEQEIQEKVDQNPLLEIDETHTNPREQSLDALVEAENGFEADGSFDPFDNDSSAHPKEIEGTESQTQISDNAPDPVIPVKDEYSAGIRKGRALTVDSDDVYEGETSQTI